MMFPETAIKIFKCFDLCLASNQETEMFLKKLKVKKVYSNGNIKLINQVNENYIHNDNEKIS